MKQKLAKPTAHSKKKLSDNSKIQHVLSYLTREPEKALQLAHKLVSQDTNDPQLRLLIGRVYQKLGNFPLAEKNYNEALALDARHKDTLYARVDLLYQTERYDEAVIVLNEVIPYFDKAQSRGFRVFLASTFLKQKKYEEAVNIYKQLLDEEPNNWLYWNSLGMVYLDLSQFDDMEVALIRADKFTKDNPIPFYNRIVGAHYNPQRTAEQILAMCGEWQKKFSVKNVVRAKAKNLQKNKRLRIGMISDGFRLHPVGNMIMQALSNILPSQMEFYAYSTNYKNDQVTRRIKKFCAKEGANKSLI